MLRSWFLWLTLMFVAATVGWYWILAQDLRFVRVEPDTAPAAVDKAN